MAGHPVRAVLDVNVLISGALAPAGVPAAILRAARDGVFEMIISGRLVAELERTLAYSKLRQRIPADPAAAFTAWVRGLGTMTEDPAGPPPVRSRDGGDDYLIALAFRSRAYLVSGDQDLLVLRDDLPVLSPGAFLHTLGEYG